MELWEKIKKNLDDSKEWLMDSSNLNKTIPLAAVTCIIILMIVLGLTIINSNSIAQTQPTPTSTPIINASTPTPIPTVTPTSTIKPTIIVAPVPWHGEDYDQYIRDLEAFYNKTETPRENQTFPDPLTYNGMQMILQYNQNHAVSNSPNYMPGHPETANGAIIYVPTPIPCPTPTPIPSVDPVSRERHKTVDNIELPPPDKEGIEAGIIAWDQEHSHILPYYSPGDHAVIVMRFVNNYCPQTITNPTVTLTVKREVFLGVYAIVDKRSWVEHITLPGVKVDQYYGHLEEDLPSFTAIYEWDIPDSVKSGAWEVDSSGNYIIEVTIDTAIENKACWFSKQVTIT